MVIIRPSSLLVLLLGLSLPYTAAAGEIYGRVSKQGRVVSGASVSVECSSVSQSGTTDRNGVYRVSGPKSEEQCRISVNGSDTITIYTSMGRTRVNLEIVGRRVIRR